jgi:hypothetical protein
LARPAGGDLVPSSVLAWFQAVERRLNPAREMAVVPFIVGMTLVGLAGFSRF